MIGGEARVRGDACLLCRKNSRRDGGRDPTVVGFRSALQPQTVYETRVKLCWLVDEDFLFE